MSKITRSRDGQVTLAFEWPGGVVVNREPADAGGNPANDGAVNAVFQPMPPISVKVIRVGITNKFGKTNILTTENLDELKARLKAIYPVAQVNETRADMIWTREAGAPFNGSTGELARLNNILWLMRTMDVIGNGIGLGNDPLASRRLYYGALPPGLKFDWGGLALGIPSDVSCGVMPAENFEYGRNRHAHELGHSLGLHHAVTETIYSGVFTNTNAVPPIVLTNYVKLGYCRDIASTNAPTFPFFFAVDGNNVPTLGPLNEGDDRVAWGWDSHVNEPVNPRRQFELMGYCGTWRWISTFTYNGVKDAITARFGPVAPLNGLAKSDPTTYRIIRGMIHVSDGTVEMLPFYTITPADPFASPTPGNYVLRLLNDTGGLIADIPFEPMTYHADAPEDASARQELGFIIPVVDDPAIAEAQVWTVGGLLATRHRSAHAPTVQVLAPNGGEAFSSQSVQISWLASDLDGDPLTYIVQYSPDGGLSWDTLAGDHAGNTLTVDPATLRASAQARVRVIASDGFLTAMDASDGTFTVLNHTPAIVITSPTPGQAVNGTQQLFLAAEANDIDDGALTGTNIIWTSSLNGFIGAGEAFTVSADTLQEGVHTLTATVLDSGGLAASATVNVTVSRDPLPVLSIERLLPDVVLSWSTNATNYHLQRALTLPGAWGNVTNAPQPVGDRWQVTLPATGPEKFYRLIKP